jgi:hypothetical protein
MSFYEPRIDGGIRGWCGAHRAGYLSFPSLVLARPFSKKHMLLPLSLSPYTLVHGVLNSGGGILRQRVYKISRKVRLKYVNIWLCCPTNLLLLLFTTWLVALGLAAPFCRGSGSWLLPWSRRTRRCLTRRCLLPVPVPVPMMGQVPVPVPVPVLSCQCQCHRCQCQCP